VPYSPLHDDSVGSGCALMVERVCGGEFSVVEKLARDRLGEADLNPFPADLFRTSKIRNASVFHHQPNNSSFARAIHNMLRPGGFYSLGAVLLTRGTSATILSLSGRYIPREKGGAFKVGTYLTQVCIFLIARLSLCLQLYYIKVFNHFLSSSNSYC